MNGKRKWTLARIQRNTRLFERLTSSPLTGEERGEGDQGFQRPLTLTLSREGRGHSRSQVGNFTADDKSTNVHLLSPGSSRGLGLVLIVMIILSLAFAGLARVGSAAEGTRFLVSYGGTAGYQLPLWVNKEFGFSRKYGVDLEIILIQAGSPNIQALVGGSLQLTQTAASSSVIAAARGAPAPPAGDRGDGRAEPVRPAAAVRVRTFAARGARRPDAAVRGEPDLLRPAGGGGC